MPQYQGVWSLQQQMQALTSGQWATDPLFDYTTLLLQADNAANSAQNNTFLDSSTNAFAITRNGNTTQGTFSPFSLQPGAWANYFGGSSDYLLLPSNSANFLHTGAADWTFECWFYCSTTGSVQTIFSTDTTSASIGASIYLNNRSAGAAEVQIFRGSTGNSWANYTAGGVWSVNTWNHLAVTFSSSTPTVAIFINGISQALTTTGSATFSSSNATYQPAIGRYQDPTPGGYFSGYISNIRGVNGSRVYTANFTPPTAALTAITNTAFLTCQSNRFVDNSTNAYALTIGGGSPSVQAFSPFAPQFQYTASGTGGSGYFDGTGDWLSITETGGQFTFGTGDYEYSCWIYPSDTSTTQRTIFGRTTSGNTAFPYIYLVATTQVVSVYYSATVVSGTSAIKPFTWTHIVVSRVSGTTRIFVNGVQEGSASDTTSLISPTAVIVGNNGTTTNQGFPGYIAGVRILKGSGSTSVTVPTAPPTAITNTQLLSNFTNAGILDGTMKNNLETVGNAQVSTSVVKYGSGSIKFNGSTDYLLIRPDAPLPLFVRTADFTVEAWIYLSSTSVANYMLWGNNGPDIQFYVNTSAKLVLAIGAVGGPTGSINIPTNTWVHVAATRTAGYINLFVNGVFDTRSTTGGTSNLNNSKYYVGTDLTSYFNGYIDDMRFTLGVARYITSFTPPTVALPRQ